MDKAAFIQEFLDTSEKYYGRLPGTREELTLRFQKWLDGYGREKVKDPRWFKDYNHALSWIRHHRTTAAAQNLPTHISDYTLFKKMEKRAKLRGELPYFDDLHQVVAEITGDPYPYVHHAPSRSLENKE